MNNKYILRFFYGLTFLLAFAMLVFYARLTLPSLVIGTREGDPLIFNNALILLMEIVLITIIGLINYYFYKKLYGTHSDTDSPWLKFVYSLIVIGTFITIFLFSMTVLGIIG